MKVCLVILLALCVSLSTAEPGGWSEYKNPEFPKDDPAVVLISKVDKELRPLLAAKVKDDPKILTAPITVQAYKTQVVAGERYDVQIEVTNKVFATYILSPLKGEPKIEKVLGPLEPFSKERLIPFY